MKTMKSHVYFLMSVIFLFLSCKEQALNPGPRSTIVMLGREEPASASKSGTDLNKQMQPAMVRLNDRIVIVPKKVTGFMEERMAFVGEPPLQTNWPIGGRRDPCNFFPVIVDFDFSNINTFIDESEDIYRNDATLGDYNTLKFQFIYLDFVFDFNGQEYTLRLYFNDYGGKKAGDVLINGSGNYVSIAIEKLWQWYQASNPAGCQVHLVDFTLGAKKIFTMNDVEADVVVTVNLDFSKTLSFNQYPTIDSEGNVDHTAPPIFDITDVDNLSIYDLLPGLMYPVIMFTATVDYK